ncbi:triphosphate tunel metalloenzyme 3 [Cucurbita pepo subsp. pepo]|uniref:triphosphate tunel metalloenzyme 3 n=1 Tax=Cucurbita pepo subsp. pepo TaxID=3664 RepID=UPI000C9DA11B|nr:triphosphate tunel metalloenzyme 3 [Cucurbita pepo subsp. pepo]XP_023538458.1 triphosphate tunel metalloenzyme 3 [Cucurbita pepo subsp. pepo]
MEVEVKLRLPDSVSHRQVSTLLSPFHVKTHRQENFFFDGSSGELSARRAVLRIRFYDGDSRCVISLKARAVLVDGVSRVEEDEEELEPSVGRACVENPQRLKEVESRIMGRVKDEFGPSGFVGLGGFGNVRGVFEWNGLKLELDESSFEFGTLYEIECESTDPDAAKKMIEDLLKENQIAYGYSEASKFSIFRSGKLP